MILSSINDVDYPTMVGNRQIYVGSGYGPASYNSTTGDILSTENPFNIDAPLAGLVVTLSGNYAAVPEPIGIGSAEGWTLKWYTFPAWVAVTGQNLSAEQIEMGVIGAPQ